MVALSMGGAELTLLIVLVSFIFIWLTIWGYSVLSPSSKKYSKEIDRYEKELQECKKDRDRYKVILQECGGRLANMENKLRQDADNYETRLRFQSETIEEMRDDLQQAHKNKVSYIERINQYEDEISTNNRDMDDLRDEIKRLQDKNRIINNSVMAIVEENSLLSKSINDIESFYPECFYYLYRKNEDAARFLFDHFNRDYTDAELGLEFEEYTGWWYGYSKGCDVDFRGKRLGLADGGIDIVATRSIDGTKEISLIQCKRRGKNRPIRENVIHQLYGSAEYYKFTDFNRHRERTPIYHTVLAYTGPISDEARDAARQLDIELLSPKISPDHKIKGNINDGRRIYHLPSCPHYRHTKIDYRLNECYFNSEAEALNNGFRRCKV